MSDMPASLFDALDEMRASEPPQDPTLSIAELYTRTKRALASAFPESVWVSGEVKSIREWNAAWFLNLVEPGATRGGGDVNLDVACWQRAPIQAQLADVGITLAAGMEVRVRGTVGISKLGKVQLTLSELDTDALIGRVVQEKQRLIRQLQTEGIFDNNKKLVIPTVPLRIGLVTSDNSEGYNDFTGQLKQSPFAFDITFVHSPVQGTTAPMLLAQAVEDLQHASIDLLVVVRGGGGELDAYDKEPIVRAIATSKIPVWVGVGHTGDRSVCDDVAHSSYITPTACGQAIVRYVQNYVERVDDLGKAITSMVSRGIANAANELRHDSERIQRIVRHSMTLAENSLRNATLQLHTESRSALLRNENLLHELGQRLRYNSEVILTKAEGAIETSRARVEGFDPLKQLARGYSLTMNASGEILHSVAGIDADQVLMTQLADGTVTSRITHVSHKE